MRTWVKLYTDIPDDFKMEQLTDRQFRVMVYAFAMAGKVDDGGRLGPLGEVAWKLRRTEIDIQEDFAALARLNILHEQDGQWYVTHFATRNARPPSSDPDAVRERVQRYRENQKQGNEDVTTLHINGNAKETPLEVEEEEKKRDAADTKTSAFPAGKPKRQQASLFPVADALAEVCRMDVTVASNKGQLFKYAKDLKDKDPADIRRYYGTGGWWYKHDWRGQKGDIPKPAYVCETWGQWAANGAQAKPKTYQDADGNWHVPNR